MSLLRKLRDARQWRYLRLVDPVLQRFEFWSVWANYLTPPSPVQVDTSVGTLTIQTGLVRSFAREYDVSTFAFPFSAEERVAFHPPQIFVAHYNEFSQIAARQGDAFLAVIPDARMGKSEWGEVEHEAFFFAPALDTEEFEVQWDRIDGLYDNLRELWPKMVSITEIVPKFSRRAEWGTGEKLVRGEWIVIRLTINIKNYELNAV
jgi:hypothetical protein